MTRVIIVLSIIFEHGILRWGSLSPTLASLARGGFVVGEMDEAGVLLVKNLLHTKSTNGLATIGAAACRKRSPIGCLFLVISPHMQ